MSTLNRSVECRYLLVEEPQTLHDSLFTVECSPEGIISLSVSDNATTVGSHYNELLQIIQ